jgi:hypothetical protein
MYVQSIGREMIPVSQVANFKVSLGKERPADCLCQLAFWDYALASRDPEWGFTVK